MSPWKERVDLLGSVLGVLGMVLVVLAVVMRLALGSAKPAVVFAPSNILLIGIAAMVAGCWFKLTAR